MRGSVACVQIASKRLGHVAHDAGGEALVGEDSGALVQALEELVTVEAEALDVGAEGFSLGRWRKAGSERPGGRLRDRP